MFIKRILFMISDTFLIFSTITLVVIYITIIFFFTLKNKIFFPVITFFLLVFLIALIKYYYLDLFGDEIYYYNSAISQLSFFQNNNIQQLLTPESKTGFTSINVFLFQIIGIHPVYGLLINAIAVSLAQLAIIQTCINFKINLKPANVAWSFFLFPQLLFFTPWFLREALAILLLSLAVLASSYMYLEFLKTSILLFLLIIPALYYTRGQLIIIALMSLGASILIYYRRNKTKPSLIAMLATFLLTTTFFLLNQNIITYLHNLNSNYFTGLILGNSNSPNRTVPPYTSPEFNYSAVGFLYNLVRSVFGPLPWEWKDVTWILLGIEGLFFLALISVIFFSLFKFKNKREIYFLLLIPLIPMWVISSITLANYGFNLRIKLHYLPFLIPLVLLSISNIIKVSREWIKYEEL